ncbi:MAG: ABC transporter permease [Vicinamibacterales bacterium]|jgi:predicted permease|nr:multidrug ABC transporter substrate-binding protein [Acidobacteriota bacterium]MDP6372240.1 ABC transporter permease [Vicinamibacterales bacterium]
MRDWKAYVRTEIRLHDIDPSTELEVIDDIASQLEDGYRDAVARGAGPEAADAEARALVVDWRRLTADIVRAKRRSVAQRIEQPVERTEAAMRRRGGVGETAANILREIRFALRRVRRAPTFSAVVILTLGLGIGANTAIFSLVKGILLDPLPYDEPDRLVSVLASAPGQGEEVLPQAPALHFTYEDDARFIERIGLWRTFGATVRSADEPVEIAAVSVTAGTLPTLRVRPARGRLFSVEDDTPGAPNTVIISHAYWESQFGSRPGIIGQTIEISGSVREIIGMLPQDFRFIDGTPAVYLPFRFDRASLNVSNFTYSSVARLTAGATIEAATDDLPRLLPIAVERFPGGLTLEFLEEVQAAPVLRPLRETIVGNIGDVLWVLLGTVGIVLLIACANVANLFVVRAEGRDREVAVRTAIGAARRQIAGQYLVESVLLGLLGGAVGVGLAQAGLRLLVAMAPVELPRLDAVSIDPGALTFTLAISLFSGVIFGLLPVVRCGRLDLVGALKEGGRGGGAGRERHLARNALVVGQVALALVLVVGAGLMVRTFQAIQRSNPGFQDAAEVLILNVTVSGVGMEDPGAAVRRHELIARRLAETTGVTSVGLSSSVTMDRSGGYDPVFVEDFPLLEGQIAPIRRFKWIGAGYFETMRNPIVAGRTLTWADIHNRARVLLVTENFAREYWGDPADAVGNRIGTGQQAGDWREIIGVVGDVRDDGVTQPPVAVVYWPMLLENYWADVRGDEPFVTRSMRYAIRSPRVGTPDFLGDLKQVIRSVQPGAPLTSARTLRDLLRESTARTSFTLVILAIAAVVALLLAAVGMYGVISYVVMQRTQEIGVRIALGAEATTVTRMVLRQGLVLAVTGVALGLVGAYWLTRLITGLLVGVSAVDPATYVTVSTTLTAIALLASYLPARRAAHVDPIQALRAE